MGRYLDIANELFPEDGHLVGSNPADTSTKKTKQTKKALETSGIPLPELRKLAGDDWPEIKTDSDLLNAFAHAVCTRRMRERGEIPPNYTQHAECAGCGPVLLWKGAPGRVQSCPWCFNRLRGLSVPPA